MREKVVFKIKREDGVEEVYNGLLNTGSTEGFIAKELVDKYGF